MFAILSPQDSTCSFLRYEMEWQSESSKTPPMPTEDCKVKGNVQAWEYF